MTHHLDLCLPKTKYTVILGEGIVEHAGFVDEFQRTGVLERILLQGEESRKNEQITNEELLEEDEDPRGKKLVRVMSRANETSDKIDDSQEVNLEQPKKFTEDEKREAGAVKLEIYTEYLKTSGGWLFWVPVVFMFFAHQGLILGRVRISTPSLLLGRIHSSQPLPHFSYIMYTPQAFFALFLIRE